MSFVDKLISWYQIEGRDLPWRKSKDPYIIWLSEVILQQTRVEQGLPYFNAFVAHYPSVVDFAKANEDELLRLWQGLGYYSRVRNMHKAAKIVANDLKGVFPKKYNELLKLSGIGEYTAAAISSFSSDERRAVLDGNVFRVLARVFGIDTAINTTLGKKQFQHLAQELICVDKPGLYNQAIMDFGATVCKPKLPLCDKCIMRLECSAYGNGTIEGLPVKIKGKKSRDRYFNYFLIEDGAAVIMSKRGKDDIWANLYEFPLIESSEDLGLNELMDSEMYKLSFGNAQLEQIGGAIKHVLSHQNIYARFYRLTVASDVLEKKDNWNYILLENLDKLAKHKLIFTFVNKYFKD